jgi:hypothetical protein
MFFSSSSESIEENEIRKLCSTGFELNIWFKIGLSVYITVYLSCSYSVGNIVQISVDLLLAELQSSFTLAGVRY